MKIEMLDLPELKGRSFLEIGCREGAFCNYARMQGASVVVGIDSVEQLILRARQRYPMIDFRCQSSESLAKAKFDVILCASAFEHLSDPYAGLQRIHAALADDGVLILESGISPYNHLMESGIHELGPAYWEHTNHSAGAAYCPSEALLRDDLLKDFSVRVIGPGQERHPNPLPRKVYHCRKLKPLVLLVWGESGAGKTSLVRELQRNGIASFSSDFMLERLMANIGEADTPLTKALRANFAVEQDARPFYRAIGNSALLVDFVEEFYEMIPKRQRLLVVEGYAFLIPKIREAIRTKLTSAGFLVHDVRAGRAVASRDNSPGSAGIAQTIGNT